MTSMKVICPLCNHSKQMIVPANVTIANCPKCHSSFEINFHETTEEDKSSTDLNTNENLLQKEPTTPVEPNSEITEHLESGEDENISSLMQFVIWFFISFVWMAVSSFVHRIINWGVSVTFTRRSAGAITIIFGPIIICIVLALICGIAVVFNKITSKKIVQK